MPAKIEVKAGERYGRLVVLGEAPKKNRYRQFDCECDCGEKRTVYLSNLRHGGTVSCGCHRNEQNRIANLKHGMYKTALFNSWHSMKQRCLNPNSKGYKHYGGRGITICDEWLEFVPFSLWAMSHGYQENLTIERIDNNGNYEPNNCTWIPLNKQTSNTRRNIRITYHGKTMILKEWSKALGVNYNLLQRRLSRGWPVERTFKEPLDITKSHRKHTINA